MSLGTCGLSCGLFYFSSAIFWGVAVGGEDVIVVSNGAATSEGTSVINDTWHLWDPVICFSSGPRSFILDAHPNIHRKGLQHKEK